MSGHENGEEFHSRENGFVARPKGEEFHSHVALTVAWFLQALQTLRSSVVAAKDKLSAKDESAAKDKLSALEKFALEKIDAQLCFVLVELTTFSAEIAENDDVKPLVDVEIKEETEPVIWPPDNENDAHEGVDSNGNDADAHADVNANESENADLSFTGGEKSPRSKARVELSFECDQCEKIFSKRQHLNAHKTRAHRARKKKSNLKKSKRDKGAKTTTTKSAVKVGQIIKDMDGESDIVTRQMQQQQIQRKQPLLQQTPQLLLPQQLLDRKEPSLADDDDVDVGLKSLIPNSLIPNSLTNSLIPNSLVDADSLLLRGGAVRSLEGAVGLIANELDSEDVSLPAFSRDVDDEGRGGDGADDDGDGRLANDSTNLSIPSPLFHHGASTRRNVVAKTTDKFLIGSDRCSQSGSEDSFFCEICGLKFHLMADLKSHKRRLHPEEKQQCDSCGEKFNNKITLKRHKAQAHGGKKILCPECGKQFSFSCAMRHHVKAAHGSQKLPCEICGKEFSTKIYLMKHKKEVHEGQRARHLCTICGKKVFILKSHMESVHLGVKYPCEKCGKEFATPPGLKVHIQTFHEGNKYPCTICDKVFGHKGYLKNHVDMVHKGKKFPCKLCPLEFNDARSRRQHTESDHQGKKHTCQHCQKEFSRHDHLMRHKQSVHEGRRFPCQICGKEFSQSGDLKRHFDSAHSSATSKSTGAKSRLAPTTVKTIVSKAVTASTHPVTSADMRTHSLIFEAVPALTHPVKSADMRVQSLNFKAVPASTNPVTSADMRTQSASLAHSTLAQQQQQRPQFALQTQSVLRFPVQHQSSFLMAPPPPPLPPPVSQSPAQQQHPHAGDILASAAAAAAVTADDFLITSLGLLQQQHQLQQNVILQQHLPQPNVQSVGSKIDIPLMAMDSSNAV